MIKILFICHGNICRSPMAQYILQDMVEKRGLADQFYIDSAATSTEELGNGVHYGTRKQLQEKGIHCGGHRARQLRKNDYEEYDEMIGMDQWNRRNMLRMLGADPQHKVKLLLDDTAHPRDIADPWYTHDFEATYQDVTEGCEALLTRLEREGKINPRRS